MGKPKSSLQQDDLTPSTLPTDHTIVKLGTAQGSNNYLSTDAEGTERLVELSGRVKRSKVIITRGMSYLQVITVKPRPKTDKRRICIHQIICCRARGIKIKTDGRNRGYDK
jgi:hypothetical protein